MPSHHSLRSDGSVDESALEGGLHAYGGDRVIACSVVFIVMCTVALVLRFYARRVSKCPVSLEDYVLIPTWVLMMAHCANALCGVAYGGVGRHEAYVLKYDPKRLIAWAKVLFVLEVIYGWVIPMGKTSVLLLYLRLFGIRRWFRYTTWALVVYIWMWGVSEVVVAVAQCQPVAFQWDKSIDGGWCIDQLAYYRWVSVPNLIHDVLMLLLPVPVVWDLRIGWRQKLALSGVFLLGSFGCVASFIRMYRFWQLNALSDKPWASIELVSWTIAEPGAILICACLPALWPLVQRFVPGIKSTSRQKSDSGTGRSGRSARLSHRKKDGGGGGGGGGGWTGHGRSMTLTHDDFIPLNDVDDRMAGYEMAAAGGPGYTDREDGRLSGRGINVTTEVSLNRSA